MQLQNSAIQGRAPAVIIALEAGGRALMKRDMELIRKILAQIKARDTLGYRSIEIPDTDPAIVARHVELLHEAGLIEAMEISAYNSPLPRIVVKDLTWAGHDLAAILENDTVWQRLRAAFPNELGSLPLAVIKSVGLPLLEEWAKHQVGL